MINGIIYVESETSLRASIFFFQWVLEFSCPAHQSWATWWFLVIPPSVRPCFLCAWCMWFPIWCFRNSRSLWSEYIVCSFFDDLDCSLCEFWQIFHFAGQDSQVPGELHLSLNWYFYFWHLEYLIQSKLIGHAYHTCSYWSSCSWVCRAREFVTVVVYESCCELITE